MNPAWEREGPRHHRDGAASARRFATGSPRASAPFPASAVGLPTRYGVLFRPESELSAADRTEVLSAVQDAGAAREAL
jgi:hypothetical protein